MPIPAKSDVLVFCPSDHSPMTAHFSDADALVCVAAGCRMTWSREEGYKRDVKDAVAEKEHMRCGNAQHGFLYIERVDRNQTVWRCIIDGCTSRSADPTRPQRISGSAWLRILFRD